MDYLFPDYYKDFNCIADKCPDTCCAKWQIVIDDKSLKKYKELDSDFGNRLINSIDWKEKVFLQSKKRCAFLDENNLCDIYTELGPDGFCKTCRNYPRHIEEFEGLREISLSISCPEVMRILMEKKTPMEFYSRYKDGEEEYEDFDYLMFTKLADVREIMFDVIRDRSVDIRTRCCYVLAFAHDVQRQINEDDIFQIDSVISRYDKNEQGEFRYAKLINKLGNRKISVADEIKKIFSVYDGFEILDDEWKTRLANAQCKLSDIEFVCVKSKYEIILEHLLMYYMFTYFLGSVYDGNAYGKVKASVYSVAVTYGLFITEVAGLKGASEETMKSRFLDVAYKYSREIEHSDDNLEIMEKKMKRITLEKAFALTDIFDI